MSKFELQKTTANRIEGGHFEAHISPIKRECAVCGLTDPLCVHHHDCNPQNNSPGNLIYLCYNHHTIVHRVLRKLRTGKKSASMSRSEGKKVVDAERAIANVLKVVSDLPPRPSTNDILTRLQTDFEISERTAYYWLKTYRASRRGLKNRF